MLSPVVFTGMNSSEMGNFIPRIVVTDPKSIENWTMIPYAKMNDDELRDYKKEIREKLKTWDSKSELSIPTEPIFWPMDGTGSYVIGKFEKVEAGNLVYSNAKGNAKRPLADLNSAAQTYAAQLSELQGDQSAAAEEAETSAGMPELKVESWTGADGKVIEAIFTSLEGDQITLDTSAGKTFKFGLDRLNPASQARAKELDEAIKAVTAAP